MMLRSTPPTLFFSSLIFLQETRRSQAEFTSLRSHATKKSTIRTPGTHVSSHLNFLVLLFYSPSPSSIFSSCSHSTLGSTDSLTDDAPCRVLDDVYMYHWLVSQVVCQVCIIIAFTVCSCMQYKPFIAPLDSNVLAGGRQFWKERDSQIPAMAVRFKLRKKNNELASVWWELNPRPLDRGSASLVHLCSVIYSM